VLFNSANSHSHESGNLKRVLFDQKIDSRFHGNDTKKVMQHARRAGSRRLLTNSLRVDLLSCLKLKDLNDSVLVMWFLFANKGLIHYKSINKKILYGYYIEAE
jgi:hypothetical protein